MAVSAARFTHPTSHYKVGSGVASHEFVALCPATNVACLQTLVTG